jgi:hypothetical protein
VHDRRTGRGRSARRRLRTIVAAAVAGLVVAAGCRAVRVGVADPGVPARSSPPSTQEGALQPSSASASTPPSAVAAVPDRRVFVLSDSVIKGAAFAIPEALSGWEVVLDGKPSRMVDAGVAELRTRRAELGSVVVVQLGNNYLGDEEAFSASLEELHALVGPDRWLILLHVYPIQANRAEVNGAIDALAGEHPNVRVADWPAVQDANPGCTYGDHLHLNMRGAEVMAGFVRDQVAEVAGRPPPHQGA